MTRAEKALELMAALIEFRREATPLAVFEAGLIVRRMLDLPLPPMALVRGPHYPGQETGP